jgi:methyl-accepting chemotaxis protein
MAKSNSTEGQQLAPNARDQLESAVTQIRNLVCAIDRLASQHLDASMDEVRQEASYYAQSLQQNAAAICGLADCLQDMLNGLSLDIRGACTVPAVSR